MTENEKLDKIYQAVFEIKSDIKLITFRVCACEDKCENLEKKQIRELRDIKDHGTPIRSRDWAIIIGSVCGVAGLIFGVAQFIRALA